VEGMIHWMTEMAREWVRSLGALGIFLGVMLETLVTIIPSPLVPMVAGFSLIPRGSGMIEALYISTLLIGVVGGLSATLGALLHYLIGLYGGRALIDRYGKYLGTNSSELDEILMKISGKNEIISIFILRSVPVFPLSVVSLGAGMMGMRILPYTLATLGGTFLRYSFLGMLGFMVGEAYEEVSSWIDSVENLLIFASVTIVLLYLVIKRVRGNGPGILRKGLPQGDRRKAEENRGQGSS